jgi:DNA polymerase-3 subunit beta
MIKRLLKSGMKTEERIRLLLSGDYWKESLKALELGGVETVVVAYHPETRRVLMEGGDMELVGRVIEGEYPPYEAIIPKDHPIRVRIETEALVRAIRAAAIFARESAHIVRFDIEKETLTIRAKAAQLGEYEVGVEATLLSGEEGEIAFNSRYLLDYLGHVKEDVVVLGMSEPLQPAAFYEGEKTDYVHVIMPVRLKGEENK